MFYLSTVGVISAGLRPGFSSLQLGLRERNIENCEHEDGNFKCDIEWQYCNRKEDICRPLCVMSRKTFGKLKRNLVILNILNFFLGLNSLLLLSSSFSI